MGLCASQARLLMLTARKSDLEFRRMQITNAKQLLAMEQEDIATEYSEKISNMHFVDINNGEGLDAQMLETLFTANGAHFAVQGNVNLSSIYGPNVNSVHDLTTSQLFDAIQNNYVALEGYYLDENGNQTNKYGIISLSSNTSIKERRYEEDDAEAEARYTEQMAKVKRKEQALDLEAQQIETQHSAVSTEIEAVQNLVKKNSETSFKYFS